MAGLGVGVAVGVAGVDDVVDDQALRRGVQPQVDEAGSGDLRRGDAVCLGQRVGEPSGQLAGVGTDLLGELQRQVAGVIAVLGVAWPLDGDRRRQRGGVERMLGQHRGRGGLQQLGQIGGIHAGHPMG